MVDFNIFKVEFSNFFRQKTTITTMVVFRQNFVQIVIVVLIRVQYCRYNFAFIPIFRDFEILGGIFRF